MAYLQPLRRTLRPFVRTIAGLALLSWLGCSSNDQTCGGPRACPFSDVCVSSGVCLAACGTDAGCPAGLMCTLAYPYCGAPPCADALVPVCVANFSPGRTY